MMEEQLPPLACRREGEGESVVLLHGGAGPETTWARQGPLASRWRLVIPWCRGFGPSPPAERQDWEVDTRDLLALLTTPAHVVAHSYGGVAAAMAAARAPSRVVSLTLIEPPLFFVAEDDPEVAALAKLARDALFAGDPVALEKFLKVAAMPAGHPDTARVQRFAQTLHDPGDARPDLAAIRDAAIPTAVVSGDHTPGLERLCDALAAALGAERVVLRGAGHAVARAPGFNAWLEGFLGRARPPYPSG
jgi:pimeloyl-ACP methyl ester carboxylesterase